MGSITVNNAEVNKKRALRSAISQWVSEKFDVEFNQERAQLGDSAVGISNWKGDLLARCLKLSVSTPLFKTEKSGDDHLPTFLSTVTATFDGKTTITTGTAEKAKLAESIASKKMYKKLVKLYPQKKPVKNKLELEKTEKVGCYKSLLNIICQKQRARAPLFKTIAVGKPHALTFKTICEIKLENTIYSNMGTASTKKQSEHKASQAVYNMLKKDKCA